jgi:2-polyprenyl-3-methyl-5-hydroxy-6-metoxy-1,4-benzoquinol methylase
MTRGYQHGFSEQHPATMYDQVMRERKAKTMVAILRDHFGEDRLRSMSLLDVGASTGFIDNYLAGHVHHVTGLDIDNSAVEHARSAFSRSNLVFLKGDAMALEQATSSIDLVVCSQVYEHVPNANQMLDEIFRVLKPGGACYFAATNRFDINEHHYHLPFLSVIPRPLAHLYVRIAGKADHYYERHFSVWTLRKMVRNFDLIDYTTKVLHEPERFSAAYMLPPGSTKHRVARFMVDRFYWLVPGYIWLLQKPVQ